MSLLYKPETARRRLKKADPVMAELIKRVGPFKIETEFESSPFEALLRAIIHQQLSGKAAGAIHQRFCALFTGEIDPEKLLKTDDATLREVGLSRAKVLAVRDLAEKRLNGTVPELPELIDLEDEAIIKRLTQVRGVGRWTVEMMLIFKLGRPDVLPVDDLGVRKGFQFAYRKKTMPNVKSLRLAGEVWRPYRSVASWYLWRAYDSVDWSEPA
ncbi:MAG: DNA-3-methyladenine glycosylase [Gammaproteobacteria bacterium]|nr:DNA-3-methyladenine glycosylase [Gammaproteobacteria bacterium]